MPTTVRFASGALRWTGFCLALLLACAPVSLADEPEASSTSSDTAPSVGVEHTGVDHTGVDHTVVPAPSAADRSDRVYVMNGATITWDLAKGRVADPNPEQARQLAASIREWMDTKLATGGGSRLPFSKELEVETLPNGLKRARLPIHLLNLSRVHVGPDGSLVESCSDAAAPTLQDVELEAAPVNEEEWQ